MSESNYGSKWWKFDFHIHSPASEDYGKGESQAELKEISPRDFLLNYMRKGIDCFAVTDHNTGGWIDKLKEALIGLEESKPIDYRPITIFPGVEITSNNRIHILAIFSPDKKTSDIDSLLGLVEYNGTKGDSDSYTEVSAHKVIKKIIESGGIAIPAHTDQPKGLFISLNGPELEGFLRTDGLLSIELIDRKFSKPEIYNQSKLSLAEIIGSDSHKPDKVGDIYTWVKMGIPSFEALKLALHDSDDGILRYDEADADPNFVAYPFYITTIKIIDGYKAGRGNPLIINFSPWLNSIIGGRGSGKSSILNYLRIALGKIDKLPQKIKDDFEAFNKIGSRDDSGMLTEKTKIEVDFVKDSRQLRIIWKYGSENVELFEMVSDAWVSKGEIKNLDLLFKVSLFSQKELYELTEQPDHILNLIDSQFDKQKWETDLQILEDKWFELRRKNRELSKNILLENNLIEKIAENNSKIQTYENRGENVFTNYKKSNEIKKGIDEKLISLHDFIDSLSKVMHYLPDFNLANLHNIADEYTYENISIINVELKQIISNLKKDYKSLDTFFLDRVEEVYNLPWKKEYDDNKAAYLAMKEELSSEEDESFDYSEKLKIKTDLETELAKINEYKVGLERIKQNSKTIFNQIVEHQKELRNKRVQIVNLWNTGSINDSIKIYINPLKDYISSEQSFREIIRKTNSEFSNEIIKYNDNDLPESGLLFNLINIEDNEERWAKRDEILHSLANSTEQNTCGFGLRFVRYIQLLLKTNPEDIDRLLIWFPADEIELKLVLDNTEENISSGSAGQRTAGILSLLMKIDKSPLIIDQPEDDLDSKLISNMVVNNFKDLKKKRQIIVVTHNPNITVNSASENIVEMAYQNGQIINSVSGALQKKEIRDAICEVMEGGKEALNKRYFRIYKALSESS